MAPNGTNDIDYITDSDELLALPMYCDECGDEIERDASKNIFAVTEETRPLCEDHQEGADRMVTAEYHYGHPNNNLDPETGEPGWLDGNFHWMKITDSKDL